MLTHSGNFKAMWNLVTINLLHHWPFLNHSVNQMCNFKV
jgi:hypothetical protein